MNNTATKQPRLIPYPVIEAAIAGETDAVNEVIRHYAIIIPTLILYSSSSFLDMITQFIALAIIIHIIHINICNFFLKSIDFFDTLMYNG